MKNIFEYPLNEKTRTYLKLEYIFSQIMETKNINVAWNYKVFFIALFELIEILEQINIKRELVKDFDTKIREFNQYKKLENVDQEALKTFLDELKTKQKKLHDMKRIGQFFREDAFLKSIKQRLSIPGGTCNFDLPNLHYWLTSDENEVNLQVNKWLEEIEPIRSCLFFWLNLLRNSTKFHFQTAKKGFFQSQHQLGDLLRMGFNDTHEIYPVVSGHKNRFSIRIRSFHKDKPLLDEIEFEMAVC